MSLGHPGDDLAVLQAEGGQILAGKRAVIGGDCRPKDSPLEGEEWRSFPRAVPRLRMPHHLPALSAALER